MASFYRNGYTNIVIPWSICNVIYVICFQKDKYIPPVKTGHGLKLL